MTSEFLAILNFVLSLGIGIGLLLHWRERSLEKREQVAREKLVREEHENWRYKEVEPALKSLAKLEGIIQGLNGTDGMRADVRRLNELRSNDASKLQRLDLQVHLLVRTLVETSESDEARKRLQSLSGSFVVNPP